MKSKNKVKDSKIVYSFRVEESLLKDAEALGFYLPDLFKAALLKVISANDEREAINKSLRDQGEPELGKLHERNKQKPLIKKSAKKK